MSAALAHRRSGLSDQVSHALGDAWHSSTGLAHDVAEVTADRASDATHAVGAVAERAASLATEIASELSRAASQRAAAAASGLRESAADITGRKRQRRRRQAIVMRRGLVIAGVIATIGLLALAARRARQPWADEAKSGLEPGDPRADPNTNSRSSRHYAAAT